MKKRFIKFISLVLSAIMLITMLNGLTIFASGGNAEYYVAPNGTGDGKTVATPAGSISVVMQTIINAGYDEGDNVTIYVAGGEGANIVPSTGLVVNQSWPWPNINGVPATTQANITITSMPDAEAPAILASATDAPLVLLANTTFKNITLYDQSGEERIHTNGYNVTFDEDVTFKNGTNVLSDYSPMIYIGSGYSWGMPYKKSGTLTVNNKSNNKKFSVVFGGYTWNGEGEFDANYINGDKSVIVNGGTVDNLYLLGFKRNAEYKSNLSVVLNGAKLNNASVSLIDGYAPVIDGSIQIIANGTTLPDVSSIISYAKEKNVPYYVMNSTTDSNGDVGLLALTDTVGTYSVKSGETATAINLDNPSKVYECETEKLTVPVGSYLVMRNGLSGKEATYYVQYGGTGDGLSPENPLATVDDAVKAANAAGLTYGDTVYINVMQSDDWNWGIGVIGAGGNYRSDEHHITTWSSKGTLTSHDYTIIVQGNLNNTVYLASNGKLGQNLDMVLGGPTIFKNITILRMRRWRGLFANGFDVSYGEGTKFACVNSDDCDSTFKVWDGYINTEDENTYISLGNVNAVSNGGGTVGFDNFTLKNTTANIALSSFSDVWVDGTPTGPTSDTENYKNDIELVFNNPRLITNLCWGNKNGGSSLLEKNLNINIKMVKDINCDKGLGSLVINGGVQIISKLEISKITEIPDNVTVNGGKWFIVNNSAEDIIDFTKIAGTFAVKNGCGVIATNIDTNETVNSFKGTLTLPEGQYIIVEADIDDGVIDTNDLTSIKKYLLGSKDSVGSFADYHYDSSIDILDLVALKKHLAGIEPVSGGFAEEEAKTLRNEILNAKNTEENYNISGTKIYVSEKGSSWASGKYKSFPTTISKVSELSLKAGDAVLFERGSLFRIDASIETKSGVTYGSYGTGDKPKFYAAPQSLDKSSVWTATESKNIWKASYPYAEVGCLVFNSGEVVGYKKYSTNELKKDFDFYHDVDNGILYLRFSGENPAERFSAIEAATSIFIFNLPNNSENVVIDNLCLKYSSCGAINSYVLKNVHITNCEIGYIGGSTQSGNTRYGNAIGNWGGGDGWYIKNNWIYQTFDSAISPQGELDMDKKHYYENMEFCNNLLEYNNADIEIWCDTPHTLKNLKMDGNICRFTSLGWGSRIDDGGIRGIEGPIVMTSKDFVEPSNISFSNNIIDCPAREIVRWDYNPGFETALTMTGNIVYVKKSCRKTDLVIRNRFQQNYFANNLNSLETVFDVFPDFGELYWYEYR